MIVGIRLAWSILVGAVLLALTGCGGEVERTVAESPTASAAVATPTSTRARTSSPTPTPTLSPSPTVSVIRPATPVPSPSPTATAIRATMPTPTATASPTATPTHTPAPTSTALPRPTPTGTPTEVPATATPGAIATPEPTSTPAVASEIPAGLFLRITSLPKESVVRSSTVSIGGITNPDAVVSVNGVLVVVDKEGLFAISLSLKRGTNLIEVIASDFQGNQVAAVLAIVYIP